MNNKVRLVVFYVLILHHCNGKDGDGDNFIVDEDGNVLEEQEIFDDKKTSVPGSAKHNIMATSLIIHRLLPSKNKQEKSEFAENQIQEASRKKNTEIDTNFDLLQTLQELDRLGKHGEQLKSNKKSNSINSTENCATDKLMTGQVKRINATVDSAKLTASVKPHLSTPHKNISNEFTATNIKSQSNIPKNVYLESKSKVKNQTHISDNLKANLTKKEKTSKQSLSSSDPIMINNSIRTGEKSLSQVIVSKLFSNFGISDNRKIISGKTHLVENVKLLPATYKIKAIVPVSKKNKTGTEPVKSKLQLAKSAIMRKIKELNRAKHNERRLMNSNLSIASRSSVNHKTTMGENDMSTKPKNEYVKDENQSLLKDQSAEYDIQLIKHDNQSVNNDNQSVNNDNQYENQHDQKQINARNLLTDATMKGFFSKDERFTIQNVGASYAQPKEGEKKNVLKQEYLETGNAEKSFEVRNKTLLDIKPEIGDKPNLDQKKPSENLRHNLDETSQDFFSPDETETLTDKITEDAMPETRQTAENKTTKLQNQTVIMDEKRNQNIRNVSDTLHFTADDTLNSTTSHTLLSTSNDKKSIPTEINNQDTRSRKSNAQTDIKTQAESDSDLISETTTESNSIAADPKPSISESNKIRMDQVKNNILNVSGGIFNDEGVNSKDDIKSRDYSGVSEGADVSKLVAQQTDEAILDEPSLHTDDQNMFPHISNHTSIPLNQTSNKTESKLNAFFNNTSSQIMKQATQKESKIHLVDSSDFDRPLEFTNRNSIYNTSFSHRKDSVLDSYHPDSECTSSRKCPGGKYCRNYVCYDCHLTNHECVEDDQCCGGNPCIYGRCDKKDKGSPGAICDKDHDCGSDGCCVIEPTIDEEHGICKRKLGEFHQCSPVLFRKVWIGDKKPKCGPCKDGLKCTEKGIVASHLVCMKET